MFGEELEELHASGALRLVTAFSRDERTIGGGRMHVTHRLKEHGAAVWRAVHECGGAVLVAGRAGAMPRDVKAALVAVAVAHGGLSEADAASFVKGLERRQRLCVEAYG